MKKHLKIIIFFVIIGLFLSGVGFNLSKKVSTNCFAEDVDNQNGIQNSNQKANTNKDYSANEISVAMPDDITDKDTTSWIEKLFSFILNPVKSAVISSIVKVISFILKYIVTAIAALILKLESYGIEKAYIMNHQIAQMDYVKIGWKFVRDFADLFFGLALILIGISTIIGYEKFNAKKMLPTLIIVALLINFSFMFCVFLIDFSNVFSDYFYHSMTQGGHWRWKSLGDLLSFKASFDQLYQANLRMSTGDSFALLGGALAGMFIKTFMAIILVVVIGGAVVLFFIRFVVLSILIIIAPIAWVFMVLPSDIDTQNVFNKWLGSFTKWLMFAPTMMFFLWLAIFIGTNTHLIPTNQQSSQNYSQNNKISTNLNSNNNWQTANISQQLAESSQKNSSNNYKNSLKKENSPTNYKLDGGKMALNLMIGDIVVIILLIAGMKTSLEFGIHGAGITNKWVSKAQSKAGNLAKRPVVASKEAGQRLARKAGGRAYDETLEKVGGSSLFDRRGLRWISNRANARLMERQKKSAAEAEKQIESLKSYNSEDLLKMVKRGAKSVPGFNKAGPLSFKAAVQAMLMKSGKALQNGQLDDQATQEIKKYLPGIMKNYPMLSGKDALTTIQSLSQDQAKNMALVDMVKYSIAPPPGITGTAKAELDKWSKEFFENITQANAAAFAGMITNVSKDAKVLEEFSRQYKTSIAKEVGKSVGALTEADITTYLDKNNPGQLSWLKSNAAKNLGISDAFLKV